MLLRRIAGLAAIAFLLALVPASADARAKYETITSFSYSPLLNSGFVGEVGSEEQLCTETRIVVVFKVKPGKDKQIGSADTDTEGRWFVASGTADGAKYYAKVKKAVLAPKNEVCLPYTSKPEKPFS